MTNYADNAYVVAKDFTDPNGKPWTAGQAYENGPQIKEMLAAGNIKTSTAEEANKSKKQAEDKAKEQEKTSAAKEKEETAKHQAARR